VNDDDSKEWIERYNSRLTRYGVSPEALGWGGGRERQTLRFKSALEARAFTEKVVHNVLDVGCGFGDLGVWMRAVTPKLEYQGIDINSNLIAIGRQNNGLDLSCTTIDSVPCGIHDLIVANGIFNYRLQHENHEAYVSRTLGAFLERANVAIAVDFMSTYVDFRHENAFHCPEELVIETIKKFTRHYVIRNDYLDFEYMAYAYV
jgi:trans-aconitate methyltransferase